MPTPTDANNTGSIAGYNSINSRVTAIVFNKIRRFGAQTFVASDSYGISYIRLYLSGFSAENSTMQCSIQGVDAQGIPDGVKAGTSEIETDDVAVGWVTFNFQSSVHLTKNSTYAIVLGC
ncbi:unnamed protein product, partial [marine sediment metagenome]